MHDTPSDRRGVMRDANFRWLLSGSVVSMLGDQLTILALPWLVLKTTGSAFATGMVVAMTGLPRAVFILIGGALVDRYTPKFVLMLTAYVNAALLGLLAVMVLGNHVILPVVFVLALAIGLASAFSLPSGTAMLPHVLPAQNLQAATSLMLGVRQVTLLVGPLLAGFLIALAGKDATQPVADARGLGLAFSFDCLSFIVSAWTLTKVRMRHVPESRREQGVLSAVRAGLATVWHDRDMRSCFSYWAVVMFCIGGSMQVALPVLANTRLHGAGSLGLLMGAEGAGSLIGMAAAVILGQRRAGSLGSTRLLVDATTGALVIPLGFIVATWQGAVLLAVIGALAGFMQVAVFTWLQRRVQPAMLGRVMSIFMFIFMGLAPLSALNAGWLMRYVSLTQLFVGSGCFLLGVVALTFMFTPMRRMVDPPPAAPN